MKVKDSLYQEFKNLLFKAKETLLNENGAPKKEEDLDKEELRELWIKMELVQDKIMSLRANK